MLIDLVIIGITIAVAVWGYRRGFSSDGLALLGFGAGALLGARIGPLLLEGGTRDPYAPVVAVPAALVIGGLFATVVERLASRARRPTLQGKLPDGVAGATIAVCLGLIGVWVVGAAATKVDSLRDTVRESTVLDNMNAVVPPPGPLGDEEPGSDPLPVIAGPSPGVRPGSQAIKRDPQVRAAAGSVAKVVAEGCGHGATGTGWVAADGRVVTNAHVVQGASEIRVQIGGRGPVQEAHSIWYDRANDIAIVKSQGLAQVTPLPIVLRPKPGTSAAILGFPGGGAYKVNPARLGRTARIPGRRVGREFVKRKVVSLRARARPGNSGGPAVDRRGRVATVVFAGRDRGHGGYGVPMATVAAALRKAGPRVGTGRCHDH